MEFTGATRIEGDQVASQLATDPSALSPATARSVAATLLADGVFSEPYCEWMPLWYELALLVPVRYADWRLGRIARTIAATADVSVSAPRFSRPRDVVVDGHPPLAFVSGFRDRFLLAAALLHLEWFVYVAAADGIDVPQSLVARTRGESLSYYAGDREALSPAVAQFQARFPVATPGYAGSTTSTGSTAGCSDCGSGSFVQSVADSNWYRGCNTPVGSPHSTAGKYRM
jgi:hypothetical protein